MTDPFPKIVGQNRIKNDIAFRLQTYNKNRFFPATLFDGKRGGGKTELMRSLAARLTSSVLTKDDGSPAPKPYIELNGASVKSISGLVEGAILPYQGAEVTFGIDEVHAVDPKVIAWLLSVIAPSSDGTSRASHNGMEFEFNFRMQSFIFATTNPEKLPQPFISRTNRLSLEEYRTNDLIEIINRNAREVKIHDNVIEDIAKTCRWTPREAIKRIIDIRNFAEINDSAEFSADCWANFRRQLSIRPYGLTSTEENALRYLSDSDGLTLTHLANKLAMDPTTVRRDVERYLLENDLIKLDGKRYITRRGQEVIYECDQLTSGATNPF